MVTILQCILKKLLHKHTSPTSNMFSCWVFGQDLDHPDLELRRSYAQEDFDCVLGEEGDPEEAIEDWLDVVCLGCRFFAECLLEQLCVLT